MGTNFYLYKKLKKKQEKEAIRLIKEKNYEAAKEILAEVEPIHIGKRSMGWKFLWDVHKFEHFEPNKRSIHKFLKSGEIRNEYGETFTFDEFINDEIAHCIDNGVDIAEYYEEKPEERRYYSRPQPWEAEAYSSRNIEPNCYGEFYIGKYRCSIHEDFS